MSLQGGAIATKRKGGNKNFMQQKLVLSILSLLIIFTTTKTVEGLSVYPSISSVKVKPGESINGKFTVINDIDAPVIVTTEIQDWIPTDYKGDRRIAEHSATYTNSLYDFIILEPENILIKARGEETIRYTISLPEYATGSYWGLVCFSTKPPAAAGGMVLVTRLVSIMLVEAETETTTKKMNIEKLYTSYGTEGLNLKVKLKNIGNTFIYPGPKPLYKIYSADGEELITEGVFGDTRLMLPQEEMEFMTEKPVELEKDKEYRVVVAVDFGAEKMIGERFILNTASFFPWREEEIKK